MLRRKIDHGQPKATIWTYPVLAESVILQRFSFTAKGIMMQTAEMPG